MGENKRIFKIIIVVFMVFTMIILPLRSKAYWSNGLNNNQTKQFNNVVRVGYWNQNIFTWNSTTTYRIGDRVKYNGITYEAKKQNTNVIPGVSPGWKSNWNQI